MFNICNSDCKKGRTLAKIEGGKYNDKIVCFVGNEEDNDEIYRTFNEITLTDGKFTPMPNMNSERGVLYISGASGSGKSFYSKLFIKNYIKMFPRNNIFLFSKLTEDSSLDDVREIKRIKIDDRLITQPFDCSDFANSLVLLDDCDTIRNKDHKKALNQLSSELLETGRHENVTVIILSHVACKGLETKTILNESSCITFFLASGAPVDYLLQNYIGLNRKQILALKRLNSRWITIFRHYPMILMTETQLLFLKDLN